MKTNDYKITPISSCNMKGVYVAITLDTRRIKKELPAAIRINCNRKTIYHRMGSDYEYTFPEGWEKLSKATGKGANKSGALYLQKEKLLNEYNKVKGIIESLQESNDFTLENLKMQLTGKTIDNFSCIWKQIIKKKKVGTASSYNDAYNSFTKHFGDNVTFDRIGVDLIKKWEDKMKAENKSKTTIGIYERACRVAVNESMRKKYLKKTQYPFGKSIEGKIQIPKGGKRGDQYIDIPTIKKLMGFTAPEEWPEGVKSSKYEAVNMWLFSYLGNGLNLKDMALLTYDKYYFQSGKTELKFIREKTKDTTDEDIEVIIPIIPELQDILDKYGSEPKVGERVFPQILNGETDEIKIKKIVSQWNSNIQDRLKVVCKNLGLSKIISMTWARHSFSTNLMFAGVPEYFISQSMGHTVRNITEGYMSMFPPEKRMEFNKRLLV